MLTKFLSIKKCLKPEIYVTPSNITNKNAVFSNYLIKQGANVILNKYDILK